ncbi:hypothetical protein VNO77_20513 [Canavalia gladiata]|uniref:Uncharacterized protein n=1 Tax=Canavalia gladiata TaxID=3824 RepID=A0AAN9QLH6_CANGL
MVPKTIDGDVKGLVVLDLLSGDPEIKAISFTPIEAVRGPFRLEPYVTYTIFQHASTQRKAPLIVSQVATPPCKISIRNIPNTKACAHDLPSNYTSYFPGSSTIIWPLAKGSIDLEFVNNMQVPRRACVRRHRMCMCNRPRSQRACA